MINCVNEIYDEWNEIQSLTGQNENDTECLFCLIWSKDSMKMFNEESHVTMNINGSLSKQAVQQLCDGLNKILKYM